MMELKLKEEIFNYNNEEFLKEYFDLLINRLTHSNMSVEKDLGNVDSSENAIRLNDTMKAFKYLLSKMDKEELSLDLIKTVANLINSSNPYISNDYRKMGRIITGTDILISAPDKIEKDMISLINCYNNNWKEMENYRKEALFHLGFIRIHPYEDGNGRTSRLLLNYNLLRQGLTPVIITDDLTEEYQRLIKDNDYVGLSNFFKRQAFQEVEVINTLFNDYLKEEKREVHKVK